VSERDIRPNNAKKCIYGLIREHRLIDEAYLPIKNQYKVM